MSHSHDWSTLPEIRALDRRRHFIRIPPEQDVPLTPRVKRLIDTAAFRRLSHISQLGLVALVYPAANHTRFEHSLGVYRLALIYLRQLAEDPRFAAAIGPRDAESLLVAALLHDLGHWPFCHPIEDIKLPDVPRHEAFARTYLEQTELAELLRRDWQLEPADLHGLLAEKRPDPRSRLLRSILSGPIDIDKMDYLTRDSLHAGVPYGRNFDQQRLVGSLCLNAAGDSLAITDKGKTAAEMMVFARYVMFSEVYWHHAVRAATAMLQRAFYLLHDRLDCDSLFRLREPAMIEWMRTVAAEAGKTTADSTYRADGADSQASGSAAHANAPALHGGGLGARSVGAIGLAAGELLDGLFGERRRLYKRLAQYSLFQEPDIYQRLARRPYPWLVAAAERFAAVLSGAADRLIAPHEVLFDAPPAKREVEFQVDVLFTKENRYRAFGDVSPVVQTLALRQFDDYVKRVRVFVHPRIADACRQLGDLAPLVHRALDELPDPLSA
ncbi:MAG: HD domain-containing protein [Planctomycetota bacterium]